MISQTTAVAFLCACACLAPCAGAEPAPDARAAIQAVYNKQDAAYARKDVAGIAATYAPGFKEIDQRTGKESNAAQALDLGFTFAMFRPIYSETNILNITLKGHQAVVTRRSRGVLDSIGNAGTRTTRLIGETLSVDTWVEGSSGWLQQRMEITGGSIGVDDSAAAKMNLSSEKNHTDLM